MDCTLVVMAAGMGSRFGGLKQIEPIGLNGESIADYSIYDAKTAGFTKVVFVIKREIDDIFREKVFERIAAHMDAECVYQEISAVPDGYGFTGRAKPWGTGHAILCCKKAVNGNFAVVNADDFYGKNAFVQLHSYLTDPKNPPEAPHYCMVGYKLDRTLTENGTVARGICDVDENGILQKIVECTKIRSDGDKIVNLNDDGSFLTLDPKSTASMNAWGFTGRVFEELNEGFLEFLNASQNNPKAEFYLSYAVGNMLEQKKCIVAALPCDEKWYGFTYKEDLETVKAAIRGMIKEGKYPTDLWNG